LKKIKNTMIMKNNQVTIPVTMNPPLPKSAGSEFVANHVMGGKGVKGKGKVHPRTGHEGPEREKRSISTLSLTSALDGGGWSTPRPGCTPRKDPIPIL
jgi:hypothetical protein